MHNFWCEPLEVTHRLVGAYISGASNKKAFHVSPAASEVFARCDPAASTFVPDIQVPQIPCHVWISVVDMVYSLDI